jgi:hypothetical protein
MENEVLGMIREMVRRMAWVVRADLGSMIDSSAKQLKGYMEMGMRSEVLKDINYRAMLKSLIPPGTGEGEAYSIVEGMVWRFVTGDQEIPKYKLKDRGEQEEAIKDLNITTQLWKRGDGQKVLVQLRSAMDDMLLKHGVLADDLTRVKNEILYDDSGVMRGEALEVYGKIKKEITAFLAKAISTRLKMSIPWILVRLKGQAPEEVLEPGEGDMERGIVKERVSPLWLNLEGVDIEKISDFVKKSFPGYQYEIFENAISERPLSDAEMAKKLKSERGMSAQTVGNIRARIMKVIRERFFPGVPQRKPEEIGDIKWKELDKGDLKDFEEYLFDKHMDTAKEDTRLVVKRVLDGLVAGKALNELVEELGIKRSTLDQYTARYIKPGYAGWIRDRIKDRVKRSFFERLFMAMEGGDMVDYDHIEAEIKHNPWTPFSDPHKKKEEGPAEEKEEPKKKKGPSEIDLGVLKSLVEDRILSKHNFDVLISFRSDYDWTDVGMGKFSPKVDSDEGFTQDDPEFRWVSYNATIDQKVKRGQQEIVLDYHFKQKLLDNGGLDGVSESHLKLTVDSGDGAVPVSHEAELQGFLDDYFVKLAGAEIPVLADSGISAKYKNEKLDRMYVNTHDFEEKLGGLGFSNLAHGQRAKEYKEFEKKRKEHLNGPGVTHEDYEWDTLLQFFKKYLLIKGIAKDKEAQAKDYMEILKKHKSKTDHLKLHDMVQFMNEYHREEERKFREKKVNPLDALKGAPTIKNLDEKEKK